MTAPGSHGEAAGSVESESELALGLGFDQATATGCASGVALRSSVQPRAWMAGAMSLACVSASESPDAAPSVMQPVQR